MTESESLRANAAPESGDAAVGEGGAPEQEQEHAQPAAKPREVALLDAMRARVRAGSSAARQAMAAALHPCALGFLTWREIGALGTVSPGWYLASFGAAPGHSEHAAVWRAMCFSIAHQHALYVPERYEPGWKHMFWQQLFVSRFKWSGKQQHEKTEQEQSGSSKNVASSSSRRILFSGRLRAD